MKLAAAGFGSHVDHGSAALRELGWRKRCQAAKFLHGLERRQDRNGKCIAIRVVCAVDDIPILRGSRPVDRRIQSHRAPAGLLVVDDIVHETAQLPGNRARTERHQFDDVAAGERQRLDYGRAELIPLRRLIRLERRGVAGHHHRIVLRACVHREIEPGFAIHLDQDGGNGYLAKSGMLRDHRVFAGKQIFDAITAAAIGHGRTGKTGGAVLRGDGNIGQQLGTVVGNIADQAPGRGLAPAVSRNDNSQNGNSHATTAS